ncbi:hypothetical protein R1flu_026268 [Riccia fluitans]|uniref:Uncharacterized protein n=1 Tax=Riccia fluitans TaxID=41844 RepID=A0ABD1XFI2_9MARC
MDFLWVLFQAFAFSVVYVFFPIKPSSFRGNNSRYSALASLCFLSCYGSYSIETLQPNSAGFDNAGRWRYALCERRKQSGPSMARRMRDGDLMESPRVDPQFWRFNGAAEID